MSIVANALLRNILARRQPSHAGKQNGRLITVRFAFACYENPVRFRHPCRKLVWRNATHVRGLGLCSRQSNA
jgi:hypothetical protein